MNLVSVSLVSIGTIVGSVTMNPVILSAVAVPGILLKTAMEMKNLQKKVQNANYAFTAYAKVLSELRNFLRGEEYNKVEYLRKLKTLDDMVIKVSLNWEKFVGKYKEEFK